MSRATAPTIRRAPIACHPAFAETAAAASASSPPIQVAVVRLERVVIEDNHATTIPLWGFVGHLHRLHHHRETPTWVIEFGAVEVGIVTRLPDGAYEATVEDDGLIARRAATPAEAAIALLRAIL